MPHRRLTGAAAVVRACRRVGRERRCAGQGRPCPRYRPQRQPPRPKRSAPKIDTLQRIRETGAITLGVRETSVPFSFIDAQKQPQGYSVDLCLKVAEAIKAELKLPRLEIKYLPVSSANRIPSLVEGRIDLECGSTTNTRDRRETGGLCLHDVRRRHQDARQDVVERQFHRGPARQERRRHRGHDQREDRQGDERRARCSG